MQERCKLENKNHNINIQNVKRLKFSLFSREGMKAKKRVTVLVFTVIMAFIGMLLVKYWWQRKLFFVIGLILQKLQNFVDNLNFT